MQVRKLVLLAGVASSSISFFAYGQSAPQEKGAAVIEEVVVTARRRNESLQDVPQTVNAVSADTIQNLRINNATDITKVVSGVSIEGGSSGSGGFGANWGIRGVSTFLNSNATPVVQFYLNDAPTGRGPGATQSFFDLGQIEVLKGPQGTLRGRSAPSGAITITTKRPDLQEAGGFLNISGTEHGDFNTQAAIGVPIIENVFALRLAGMIDDSDGNAVESSNSQLDPYLRSEAVRASLRFSTNDHFDANLMYQQLSIERRSFSQVSGQGNGINGPAIDADDLLGITDGPNEGDNTEDYWVGQVAWSFAEHTLDYVGSYRRSKGEGRAPQDTANDLPGVEYYQFTETPAEEYSHELRLSSDERVFGMFDYTVGAFYDKETSNPKVTRVARFLTGAFGAPGMAVVQDPLQRYTLNTDIRINPEAVEKSVFANVTAHITDATELAVGGRFIDFQREDRFTLDLLGGYNALNNPVPDLFTCEELANLAPQLAGAISSPVYAGACDLPIPSRELQSVDRPEDFTPFIYNISLSHKFTQDFMVYGNVGTAFRSAGPQIGLTGVLSCCEQAGGPDLGSLEDLVFHDEEESRTSEIGFKSNLLDNRLRLNFALFHQTFDNYYFLTQSTRYLSVTDPSDPASGNVSSSEFTADADAKVHGVDLEVGFQISERWILNMGYTWSEAELDDASIPCNDGNFDGSVDDIVPTAQDFEDAGVMVAYCESDESISRTPKWNLTMQSEYYAPISDGVDGFIRGNFVYYPDNPNSSQGVEIDSYNLLDLFAGIRSADNTWEVSVFGNNILNTEQALSINPVAPVSSGGVADIFDRPASNYQTTSYTPRREFGLMVRYAFGSR